jgi:preprotein translocase subunit SecA
METGIAPSGSVAGAGSGGVGVAPSAEISGIGQQRASVASPLGADFENVGRNEPCPCGSGKKFKKCHGAAG